MLLIALQALIGYDRFSLLLDGSLEVLPVLARFRWFWTVLDCCGGFWMVESCYTQTDPTTQNDFISKQDFERFLTDFEDFKKYMHCEMLSIKADVASRQKPQNPTHITRRRS